MIRIKDPQFKIFANSHRKDKSTAVLRWFEEEPDFLLIFNDIDPRLDLDKYIPKSSTGHIILISKSLQVAAHRESREIKKMGEDEAIQMLLTMSHTEYESRIEMQRDALPTVYQLDYIPGSIQVASKYIVVNRINLKQYHERLKERKQSEAPLEKDIFGGAWNILALALDSLDRMPLSMRLLKLFAFLDGMEIGLTL